MAQLDRQLVVQAEQLIADAQCITIVAHQKPDGDTLGASLALWHWLRARGKEARVFCSTEVPEPYLFLPGADQVTMDAAAVAQCELLIVCDSGDLKYAGIDRLVGDKLVHVLNFDHHASNQMFGTVNFVDVAASSTAEVVYAFLAELVSELNQDIAQCLLTAVFTDTGGFINAATNPTSLSMAAEFVRYGASIPAVCRATVANKSMKVMALWGKVLSRLRESSYGVAYTYILQRDLHEVGLDDEAIEGLSNYLILNMRETKAIMVLSEREQGMVKVSMRTSRDDIDLAKLACAAGGGGHQKAAGFCIPGVIERMGERLRVSA